MADIILLKGVSHTAMPLLAPREPAVSFDPMTGDAKLWIGTTVGNEMVSGVPGPAGPAGLNSAGVAGIVSTAPGTGLTAARGDGVADDTAAIQGQISAAQLAFVPVLFSTGLYSLTVPLQVCRPAAYDLQTNTINIQPGFLLRGLTAPSIQPFATTGNMLQMTAAGQDAVLQIGKGACTGSLIENLALDGGAPGLGTKTGIHTLYDYWSRVSLVNVRMSNVDWPVWIDGALGGGNGEFFNAYNCNFSGRVGCYKNTSPSGQALIHTLTACSGGTDNGGTQFFVNDGQLNVFGWSSTQGAGPLPNVFLRLDATLSGHLSFVGGRCELVDTLVSWGNGNANNSGTVEISGFDFVGMPGDKPFLLGGTENGTGCAYRLLLKNNKFGTDVNPGVPMVVTVIPGGSEQLVFEDCDFAGWSSYAALTSCPRVLLVRCRFWGPEAGGTWHPLLTTY